MEKDINEIIVSITDARSDFVEQIAQLRSRTAQIATWVIDQIPSDLMGVEMPRGYRAITMRSNVGSEEYLSGPNGDLLDARGGYLHGDFSCPTPSPSRAAVERFADDINDGWLAEVNEWLQKEHSKVAARVTTVARFTVNGKAQE